MHSKLCSLKILYQSTFDDANERFVKDFIPNVFLYQRDFIRVAACARVNIVEFFDKMGKNIVNIVKI